MKKSVAQRIGELFIKSAKIQATIRHEIVKDNMDSVRRDKQHRKAYRLINKLHTQRMKISEQIRKLSEMDAS